MIKVKLYTHEVVGEIDEDEGPEISSKLLILDLPESVAGTVARLFFSNGGGDTSVHVDTVRRFRL